MPCRMGERTLNIAFAEPKNSELAATGQTLQPAKVYVGGLPEGTTDTKLQAFFSEYGEACPPQAVREGCTFLQESAPKHLVSAVCMTSFSCLLSSLGTLAAHSCRGALARS